MYLKKSLPIFFIAFFIFAFGILRINVLAHPSFFHIGGNEDSTDESAADENSEEDKKAQEKIDDIQDKIEEYEEKLNELQEQEETLANKITYFDSQVNLTQLKIESVIAEIQQKERQIARLSLDIEDLGYRIDHLQDSIVFQQDVLNKRMRERYKNNTETPFMIVFGSDTVQTLLKKSKYLSAMEYQDQLLLGEMKRTKDNFSLQKSLFEDKKKQSEELKYEIEVEKSNLESYRVNLEDQKRQQKQLLELTQNDESKYQRLLDEARKELDQITGAASVLKNTKPRYVEKGELIGVQGNTGYSFGDHLHFGVYEYESFAEIDGWNWYYSNYVDPAKKLKKKEVYWNTGCESSGSRDVGKGDWKWPMDSPTVSQGFGHTCYSNTYYGGKPHPAFDMYGPIGSYVYAAEEGDAYFCRNCLGDGGNGVFIFHPDGYMTLYWHLQ